MPRVAVCSDSINRIRSPLRGHSLSFRPTCGRISAASRTTSPDHRRPASQFVKEAFRSTRPGSTPSNTLRTRQPGSSLAAADKTARLCNITAKSVRTAGHGDAVLSPRPFSRRCRLWSRSAESRSRLWTVGDGKHVRDLLLHSGVLRAVYLSKTPISSPAARPTTRSSFCGVPGGRSSSSPPGWGGGLARLCPRV